MILYNTYLGCAKLTDISHEYKLEENRLRYFNGSSWTILSDTFAWFSVSYDKYSVLIDDIPENSINLSDLKDNLLVFELNRNSKDINSPKLKDINLTINAPKLPQSYIPSDNIIDLSNQYFSTSSEVDVEVYRFRPKLGGSLRIKIDLSCASDTSNSTYCSIYENSISGRLLSIITNNTTKARYISLDLPKVPLYSEIVFAIRKAPYGPNPIINTIAICGDVSIY